MMERAIFLAAYVVGGVCAAWTAKGVADALFRLILIQFAYTAAVATL